MTPKQKKFLTNCINQLMARCGRHNGNEEDYMIAGNEGVFVPGVRHLILASGVEVGAFSFSYNDRDVSFVGKEHGACHPADLLKGPMGAYFINGPKNRDILELKSMDYPPAVLNVIDDNSTKLFDFGGVPMDSFEYLSYYLVYESESNLPQEIGGRFAYSINREKKLI